MRKSFDKCSDEELIGRLRDGDRSVMDYIMNKYKNMVRSKARSMYILGADQEDLIQEGMIGLFKAVRDYDSGRDASFSTFADLCISRQMYTAVESSRREKHIPLNTYVSIYSSVMKNTSDAEDAQLLDVLPELNAPGPEDMVIDEESVKNIGMLIDRELSPLEKQVLDLYMVGMRNAAIARVLDRSEKSTDNALQRIKSKLRKAIAQQQKQGQ